MKVLAGASPVISDRVISIVSSMIYVGQFLSPVVLEGIGKALSINTIRFQYGLLARSLILSVIFMYIYKGRRQKYAVISS